MLSVVRSKYCCVCTYMRYPPKSSVSCAKRLLFSFCEVSTFFSSRRLQTYVECFGVLFEEAVLLSEAVVVVSEELVGVGEGAFVVDESAVLGLKRVQLFLESVEGAEKTRLLSEGPLEHLLVNGHENPVLLAVLVGVGAAAAKLLHVDVDDVTVLHLVLENCQ
jgi:hypothetical protein